MEKVALQFQTSQRLTDFRKYAGNTVFSTEVANLIVYCNGTTELITVAVKQYEAIVIDLPNS